MSIETVFETANSDHMAWRKRNRTLRPQRAAINIEFGTLVCQCPTTRRAVRSGIEMDQRTFRKIRKFRVRLYCDKCETVHAFSIATGALVLDMNKCLPE